MRTAPNPTTRRRCLRLVPCEVNSRKTASVNPLSRAHQTNKVQIEEYFGLQRRRRFLRAESCVDPACRDIFIGLNSPWRYFHLYASCHLPDTSHERWQQNRGCVVG